MEFVCIDPKATVRGLNVLATVDAFQLVPDVARRMLARHHLSTTDLKADAQVPVQRWLDALREIATTVGIAKLRAVGAKVVESALFPPSFPDVISVLVALDDIYHLNHQGEVGHYRSSVMAGGRVRIVCETPYPAEFERGLIEGITRNANLARGRRYDVSFQEGEKGGKRTCTLLVSPL